MVKERNSNSIIGWREWIALPELKVTAIKAKIDTGANTSSLHAFEIEQFKRGGGDFVRFQIHPRQKSVRKAVQVEAPLLEMRRVRSSNGLQSERPVIITQIAIFDQRWDIELTLANRDQMGFRMLLGREAIRGRLLVDVGASYCDKTRIPIRKKK